MTKFANRAKMSISSTGTGNVTLNAAETGYQTFAQAGIVDSDSIRYIIEDGTAWEIGIGLMSSSATVMARTVEESSNSNNALDLTSSAKVLIGITAQDFEANPAPRWTTTPATSIDLANDGSTAVTLTGVAVDENFPVRYSWDGYDSGGSTIYDASSLPPQLASAPVINQSTGVTSLVGSSTGSNAGTYYHRSRATDGINTTTQTTEVKLQFIPTSGMTGWYDAATSTIGTSGGQPTISDVSGSNNDVGLGVNTPVYSATGFANKPSIYSNSTTFGNIVFSDANYSGGAGVGSMYLIMTNELTSKYQADDISNTINWGVRNHTSSTGRAMSLADAGTTNAVLRVDKTDVPNPTASGSANAYCTLINSSTTKMHSIGITNVDFGSSGVRVFGTSAFSGGQNAQGHFRAILFYNRNLSNTEMDQLHDYYKNIYGSDMS